MIERQDCVMFDNLFGITIALADSTAAGAAAGTAATGVDAAATGAAGTAQLISMAVSMVLMIAVFYFLLIRPQRKKDKKVKDMLNALKTGDRICTIGGIYGTITHIKDDTITLAVGSDHTEMVVARWAIRNVEKVSVENEGELLT